MKIFSLAWRGVRYLRIISSLLGPAAFFPGTAAMAEPAGVEKSFMHSDCQKIQRAEFRGLKASMEAIQHAETKKTKAPGKPSVNIDLLGVEAFFKAVFDKQKREANYGISLSVEKSLSESIKANLELDLASLVDWGKPQYKFLFHDFLKTATITYNPNSQIFLVVGKQNLAIGVYDYPVNDIIRMPYSNMITIPGVYGMQLTYDNGIGGFRIGMGYVSSFSVMNPQFEWVPSLPGMAETIGAYRRFGDITLVAGAAAQHHESGRFSKPDKAHARGATHSTDFTATIALNYQVNKNLNVFAGRVWTTNNWTDPGTQHGTIVGSSLMAGDIKYSADIQFAPGERQRGPTLGLQFETKFLQGDLMARVTYGLCYIPRGAGSCYNSPGGSIEYKRKF